MERAQSDKISARAFQTDHPADNFFYVIPLLDFFQKFMKENGVIERLTEMGIEEGDTVRLYNLEFDYYR